MQIGDCHFDLPLFAISSGNSLLTMNAEKGNYMCLFSEELLAERARPEGYLIRCIDFWEQLYGFMGALESMNYRGVCFDFQQTDEGPKSKFAFDWHGFKDALKEEIDA